MKNVQGELQSNYKNAKLVSFDEYMNKIESKQSPICCNIRLFNPVGQVIVFYETSNIFPEGLFVDHVF